MCRMAAFLIALISWSAMGNEQESDRQRIMMVPSGMKPEQVEELRRLYIRPHSAPTRAEIDERFRQNSVYRGTLLVLPDGPVDKNLFLDIAIAFLQDDPCPKERLVEFSHCIQSSDVAVVSWSASVRGITRQSGTKYLVVMEVRPDLVARGGGVAFTPNECTEEWEWDGNKLTFRKLIPGKRTFKAVIVD